MRIRGLLAIVVLGLAASGCSSIEPWVKPYDRENLADPIMGGRPAISPHNVTGLPCRSSLSGSAPEPGERRAGQGGGSLKEVLPRPETVLLVWREGCRQ